VRRIITSIVATGALAVAAPAASSALLPSAAHAAGCSQWQLPANEWIYQRNGWQVEIDQRSGRWEARAYPRTGYVRGNVDYLTVTGDAVSFRITWDNGSAGVYTGTVDANGYASGVTVDRWHPQNRTYWSMKYPGWCVR
jgi:hypothetical protein